MNYMYSHELESAIPVLAFYVTSLLTSGVWSIAAYVLRSLGVYTVAKRRGVRNPWMAWVPVADYYLLGCISDQYRYVVKGQNKNKRRVLLALAISQILAIVATVILCVVLVFQAVGTAASGATEQMVIKSLLPSVVGIGCVSLILSVLAILLLVFRSMALYDLYTSCSPENNVLFLVLSLLVSVTEPFFIFFSRNLDKGMPPRKDAAPAEPVQAPVEELPELVSEEDPWDRPDLD